MTKTAPAPRFRDVQEQSRIAALCALATHANPAMAALAVIDVAHTFFNRLIPVLSLQDTVQGLACSAGCSTCCHKMVGVSGAEIAMVQQAIDQLPPQERKSIRAQSAKLAKKAGSFSETEWWAAKIPCPLLNAAGQCRIHAARPLPCRAMNSADAELCRRSFDEPMVTVPILAAQHGTFGHAQAGLIQALAQMGHRAGPFNLAVSL